MVIKGWKLIMLACCLVFYISQDLERIPIFNSYRGQELIDINQWFYKFYIFIQRIHRNRGQKLGQVWCCQVSRRKFKIFPWLSGSSSHRMSKKTKANTSSCEFSIYCVLLLFCGCWRLLQADGRKTVCERLMGQKGEYCLFLPWGHWGEDTCHLSHLKMVWEGQDMGLYYTHLHRQKAHLFVMSGASLLKVLSGVHCICF